ncbi:MAG: excinuclease ABC subunit UvrC [Elusimicrobia bacterium]|nr:excinuclease ABC subunit UvrC [Elusimicrobiota bacterium]
MKTENLPDRPGVYLFMDSATKVIYVGKALSIKKRVRSHFGKDRLDSKQIAMISVARTVDYIVTRNEKEALVLEEQLIKSFKPRYNILLKDDKSFPYIEVSLGEEFPAVAITRDKKKPGSRYFGPFPNVADVRAAKRVIDRVFPLRKCRVLKPRRRPCLNHQIGKCLAPCTGKVSKGAYREMVEDILMFLSGRHKRLQEKLRARMISFKNEQKYEEAAWIRDQISELDSLFPIVNFRDITRKKMDALSAIDPLYMLKEQLGLDYKPSVIEGFDISHTSSSEAVGSMVSFRDGRPDRKMYRKFRIKQPETADDIRMLEEVIYRRLKRLVLEKKRLPDIIFVDGGRAQEKAARDIVAKFNMRNINVLSLAKESGRIYHKGRVLRLEKSSGVYGLLKRVDDEAHRFAHSYHLTRRRRKAFR